MEGKSKIAVIPNKYKDTLDNLINSLDIESLDQPESADRPGTIDKGIRNLPRSRSALSSLLENDCLDKDALVTLLERAPCTQDFEVYECHGIALFSPKSRKHNMKRDKGVERMIRIKAIERNKRVRGVEGGHCGNKINLVIRKRSGSEANVYYHILCRYYQRLIVLR